jgi:hypothetical protein
MWRVEQLGVHLPRQFGSAHSKNHRQSGVEEYSLDSWWRLFQQERAMTEPRLEGMALWLLVMLMILLSVILELTVLTK